MATAPENRPKTGPIKKREPTKTTFKAGVSGNPGGRPKKTQEQFKLEKACEDRAPEALDVVVELMREAKQSSVRLAAATYVIERRYGKPVERKEVRHGALDDLPVEELEAMDAAIDAIRAARVASAARA